MIPARTDEIVYPEFNDREVVAGITVMDKVQMALFPEPGEALQVCFGQVIMFVQVQMPAKCRKNTNEVSDHHRCNTVCTMDIR